MGACNQKTYAAEGLTVGDALRRVSQLRQLPASGLRDDCYALCFANRKYWIRIAASGSQGLHAGRADVGISECVQEHSIEIQ